MTTPLQSLIDCGTKVWLDSVDPDEVLQNRAWGVTGATSNPVIIADLVRSGRFDYLLLEGGRVELSDEENAWYLVDRLVRQAQEVFLPVWTESFGDDGYVSFELDPLLEDSSSELTPPQRTARYVELGKHWGRGHKNRMIKVPATPAGLAALEELAAAGITLNVTLIFSERQYQIARDNLWRGARRRASLDSFKSVYSIFVSRVDVCTAQHFPELSPAAQGQVGIVTAKRVWQRNQEFWADKNLPLRQEVVFASTGPKLKGDAPWKYVEAFAGSDIETNPPATNKAVQESGRTFTRQVDQLPPQEVLDEIDAKVDKARLEALLMEEGIVKFANPQKDLLAWIAQRRAELAPEVPA
jgi:transaldolase